MQVQLVLPGGTLFALTVSFFIPMSVKMTLGYNFDLFYFRVAVKCTYPLASLHRLFSFFRFESDTAGVGSIINAAQSKAGTVLYHLLDQVLLVTLEPENFCLTSALQVD